ncbi:MAG: universal stress protein [Desulfobacteraceae bacterium]|nr:MAG: universal stress protein [Desulfobacteraceae bacterium]
MLPLKKILVTTDFSTLSHEGIKVAAELAAAYSSELILLHVVPPPHVLTSSGVSAGKVQDYYGELIRLAKESLQEVAQIHFKKGLAFSIKVIQGDPADEIVKLASEEKAGLIVMSTRGSSGRAPYMAGSVAVKVAGMAPCPVMAVPGT